MLRYGTQLRDQGLDAGPAATLDLRVVAKRAGPSGWRREQVEERGAAGGHNPRSWRSYHLQGFRVFGHLQRPAATSSGLPRGFSRAVDQDHQRQQLGLGDRPFRALIDADHPIAPTGRRAALFLTKSYVRLVRPTLDRLEPQLPDDASDRLRRAWTDCETAFEHAAQEARIAA